MSYASEIAETTSRKLVLAEIDIGKNYTPWYNEGPGVWKCRLYYFEQDVAYGFQSGGFGYSPYEESGTADIRNVDFSADTRIGSLQEDGTELTESASLADVYSTAARWYFDEGEQLLYVHPSSDWVHEHTMTLGVEMRAANDSAAGELGQGWYEPRVRAIPSLSKSKGSATRGMLSYGGGSVTLDNSDGFYDALIAMDLYGQQARLLFGTMGMTYSEFITTRYYVNGFRMDYETMELRLEDDTGKLARSLPVNVFDQTTYTNLDDKHIGKEIPIFYGQVYNAEVICVNSEEGGNPAWTFKVCDVANHSNGIQAIDAVYVDGVATATSSTDLTNGTFTLANGDWDGSDTVTFDGKGLKDSSGTYLTNPLDILADILEVFIDIEYGATEYDTTEWDTAKTDDLCNSIGLWLDEDTEIGEIVKQINDSIWGDFFRRDLTGKYTYRIPDLDADPRKTVYLEQIMDEIEIEPDADNVLSRVKVGYRKDQDENEYRWYDYNDLRETVFSKYSRDRMIEVETLLLNATDAAELAEAMGTYFDEAEPIYRVPVRQMFFDIDINDVVNIEVARVDKSWQGFVKSLVIGFTKDLYNNEMTLDLRRIESFTGDFFNESPYAINIDEYAINIDAYAISYQRLEEYR